MADRLYACHNRPRPVAGAITHQAQDGWRMHNIHDGAVTIRSAVPVDIRHVMSTDCRYDASATDPGCAGCEHAKGSP